MNYKKAVLILEDGSTFFGSTYGLEKTVCGEVVFNTALTGYQEICTDPSYAHQIVVFTTPHIGNVGVSQEDHESGRVWVKGLIVLEMSKNSSNWRSEKAFISFLQENQIAWIEGIDTRKLTRHLREKGTKRGCMMAGNIDLDLALQLAREDEESYPAWEPLHHLNENAPAHASTRKIAIYDFGVKANILRKLSKLGCCINVFPGSCTAEDILSWQPDGVVISNGAGDPSKMQDAIRETQKLISRGMPIFGICLGCQLIALAVGGQTKKMKFGHHGTNHPVCDLARKKIFITSQNHNFTIDEKTIPSNCLITHQSLFDGSIQGICLKRLPVFGFQGHPEGSPGPDDIDVLFEEFLQSM